MAELPIGLRSLISEEALADEGFCLCDPTRWQPEHVAIVFRPTPAGTRYTVLKAEAHRIIPVIAIDAFPSHEEAAAAAITSTTSQ